MAFTAFAVVDRGPTAQRQPEVPGSAAPVDRVAVPVGFAAQDVAFVGVDGWAVGTAPCVTGTCSVQVVTSDGGRTWSRREGRGLPSSCTDQQCVRHVRFADERLGYAYGAGMWITTDGGRNWATATTASVEALEVSGGSAVRVVAAPSGGCAPGCTFQVQRSDAGSLVWTTVASDPHAFRGEAAALARRGDRVVAAFYGHTAGGAGTAETTLLRSDDAGATWLTETEPCSPDGVSQTHEVDTRDLALGAGGTAALLCVNRFAGESPAQGVRVSTDSGRTYSGLRELSFTSDKVRAAGPARLLAEVYPQGRQALLLSEDGGRTWQEVASQPLSDGILQGVALDLGADGSGTWVGRDGAEVWRTSDGGRTWRAYPFVG